MAEIKNLVFEDCRIVFRNFAGEEGQYNRKGDRNFCVIIDHALAPQLVEEGWNIKYLKPREEGDVPQPYLQVKCHFGKQPPRIVLVGSSNKRDLDEGTVNILDWAEIERVDLIVRPYEWEVNGKTGIKAYLKTIYVTIVEDPLEARYMDVPDRGSFPAPSDDDAPPWDR